jgi:insulysin
MMTHGSHFKRCWCWAALTLLHVSRHMALAFLQPPAGSASFRKPRLSTSGVTSKTTTTTELKMVNVPEGSPHSEESVVRRQLLFSLLAAAGGMVLPSVASAEEALATVEALETEASPSSVMADWSTLDIVKPPLDDRDYLVYVLDNGLRVVLCSDPTSTEGGAAMDVHVGACSDPVGINGLAHFNEHMLFLGTKPYPNEDSFESFLSTNGGSSNAYTDSENTVYHFTMTAEAEDRFSEGLSRFGSFFSSPLFTEAATGRELNAIESEHAKNLQADNFRIYQLEKARQNKDHPHAKFFTGNKKTLLDDTQRAGLNLRQELIDFYNRYYSANQMTLAIVGPQSIDTLKEMVNKGFADIPNKNVAAPEDAWKGIIAPYNGNSLIPAFGHMVKVVPVKDLRQVSIAWPILYANDQDRTNALLNKQSNYVSHLVGHEGPGSLLSYLKRQGWANSLGASAGSELSDFEMFEITVGLTIAGLGAIDQIIEAIFSYIGMLRDQAIPKYVYEEVLQIEELQWRFLPKGRPDSYVQSLSTGLQKYPPSLVVAGPRRLALALDNEGTLETSSTPRAAFASRAQFDLTQKLTLDLVNQLTVDRALFTTLSTAFQGETDQKEEIYGTEFRCDPIPETTLSRWRNGVKPKALRIGFPRPNVFIPSEAGLQVKNPPTAIDRFLKRTFEDRLTPRTPPRIIRDDGPDGPWTVYYKPDSTFGQPKGFVIFELLTKEVYASAENAALAGLYETCASDKLQEYAYDGKLHFYASVVGSAPIPYPRPS